MAASCEPGNMKTRYDPSGIGKLFRRGAFPTGRGRWFLIGALMVASVLVHGWFRQAVGSPWLALSGTCLVLALMLLPLRCQLGRCG